MLNVVDVRNNDKNESLLYKARRYARGGTKVRGMIFIEKVPGNYLAAIHRYNGGYRVFVGCRWFTPEQARRHWRALARNALEMITYAKKYNLTMTLGVWRNCEARAKRMLELLPIMEKRAKRARWI